MLVFIKNLLFPRTQDRKALLPTATSYDSLNNQDDETLSNASNATTSSQTSGMLAPRVLSDMIIGLSDGLTVPFALTAGLTNLGDTQLVITGGFAELISGAISMGLGGYLAAQGESEYYDAQFERQLQLYEESPFVVIEELQSAISEFSVSIATQRELISDLQRNPKNLIRFNLQMSQGLEEPETSRQFWSAMTIGLSYFLGGFIPMVPYFFVTEVMMGLYMSSIVMAITLFAFGSGKTIVAIGWGCGTGRIAANGVKMMVTGGVAAAAAWALVKAIDN